MEYSRADPTQNRKTKNNSLLIGRGRSLQVHAYTQFYTFRCTPRMKKRFDEGATLHDLQLHCAEGLKEANYEKEKRKCDEGLKKLIIKPKNPMKVRNSYKIITKPKKLGLCIGLI